jgi:phage gpG-like protein
MNEEIYDPDCGACERAQQDYAELERVTDDLAALVRQLVRSLRKAAPDNELADKALDYLKRKGLQGSPLRHNTEAKPSGEATSA